MVLFVPLILLLACLGFSFLLEMTQYVDAPFCNALAAFLGGGLLVPAQV